MRSIAIALCGIFGKYQWLFLFESVLLVLFRSQDLLDYPGSLPLSRGVEMGCQGGSGEIDFAPCRVSHYAAVGGCEGQEFERGNSASMSVGGFDSPDGSDDLAVV